MDNITIFNLQNLAAFLMAFLGFIWWVAPRLKNLSIYDALLPLVFFNGIRFLGMMFMVEHQIYDEFPKDVAMQIGWGDYIVSILALFTAIALKYKWKLSIALAWLVNILGFVDLMNAFPKALAADIHLHDIGGIWYMMLLTGPITIIIHIYIFIRLIKNLNQK